MNVSDNSRITHKHKYTPREIVSRIHFKYLHTKTVKQPEELKLISTNRFSNRCSAELCTTLIH